MKKRIAIFGMGGVGGYLGGFMAREFAVGNSELELIFIARGAHYKAIAENGLEMKTTLANFNAKASMVVENTDNVGVVDYIVYTTKSYDTLASIPQLLPMIGPQTVIITFMNGVDGEEILRENLAQTTIWSGCAFIVSMIDSPGVIYQDGKVVKYLFGLEGGDVSRMKEFEALCARAGLDVKYHDDIEVRVLSKLHFISAVATLTSYLNKPTGEIMSTPELKDTLRAMMQEFKDVVEADSRKLIDDVIEKNLKTVHIMPYESTSSMQRDFAAGKRCEVEALCGYIVRLGQKVNVETPLYSKMYEYIKNKQDEN